MAFANPPVVSAPAPIPNGIGIQQTPHAYLYHPQQIAALAAKAGAAQYMPPVIYYPYPIPVSQQTPPPAGMCKYFDFTREDLVKNFNDFDSGLIRII